MNIKPVQIEGFATIRKDRKELNGGGLLLFTRIHLTYEKFQSAERAGREIQAIRIRSSKTQWLHLHNVYLANTDNQAARLDASMINATPNSTIIGDFNGHSHFWGSIQPPDAAGKELQEWIYDLNLQILNDGSPTRTSRITGSDSFSDLSLSGRTWSMYVCMYNLFKVGKIYKDSKLYLQDIQSLIKTDDTDVK